MQRIVIVGGGAAALMVANILTRKLLNDIYQKKVEVVLISDSEWHYYKPAFMYVAFNLYLKEELRKSQRSLLRPEIQFIHDRVEHFDFASQTLQGKSGTKYGYDYLVIATGCQPRPDRISGMKEAADHFYQYQPARQLAEKLAKFEKGRIFITVSFPNTPNVPHQCGIAPMETTLMLDDYFRQRRVRQDIEIVYTYPTVSQLLRNCLFMQKDVCEVLPAVFQERNIQAQRGFTLERVCPEKKIAYSKEGEEQPFDLLIGTPPISAVESVRNTGLSDGDPEEGWLPTDPETLQVYGLKNVYVLGDTVDLPISKAAGSCHNQSTVVVDNIIGEMRFGYTTAIYDGRVQAVAQMGLNAGMPLQYDYKHDVLPTPATKLGGLLRTGFNRGLYWSTVRGLV